MPKFRKKPVVVEAQEWPNESCWGVVQEYMDHAPDSKAAVRCRQCERIMDVHGWVVTVEGGHIVCPGDRIIKGMKGEFYPCKPDIFKATYEAVKEDDTATLFGPQLVETLRKLDELSELLRAVGASSNARSP